MQCGSDLFNQRKHHHLSLVFNWVIVRDNWRKLTICFAVNSLLWQFVWMSLPLYRLCIKMTGSIVLQLICNPHQPWPYLKSVNQWKGKITEEVHENGQRGAINSENLYLLLLMTYFPFHSTCNLIGQNSCGLYRSNVYSLENVWRQWD